MTGTLACVLLALVADLLLALAAAAADSLGADAGGGMNALGDAFVYLNDPLNWTRPRGILDLPASTCGSPGWRCCVGLLVAVPIGIWLGHTGRGGGATVGLVNISRAVPTLALLDDLRRHPDRLHATGRRSSR